MQEKSKSDTLYISYKSLEKLVEKAYTLTGKLPKYYPTVDVIDEMMESPDMKKSVTRENYFKYFTLCILFGFSRDDLWHAQNPGKIQATPFNLISYLMTPVKAGTGVEPHVGIWSNADDEEEIENRQAAFEYMQDIIRDKHMYIICQD